MTALPVKPYQRDCKHHEGAAAAAVSIKKRDQWLHSRAHASRASFVYNNFGWYHSNGISLRLDRIQLWWDVTILLLLLLLRIYDVVFRSSNGTMIFGIRNNDRRFLPYVSAFPNSID